MDEQLRILLVEDMVSDAKLAEREIRKSVKACEFKRVDTYEDFILAVQQFCPDVVITDYRMPHFDGMTALKRSKELSPFTPVIILTGAINEDTAVECMKAGAADYVIKEHLKRLGQAVIHALEEKKIRAERYKAEEALREREMLYRTLVETLPDAITVTDAAGNIIFASETTLKFYGYESEKEIRSTNFASWLHPASMSAGIRAFQSVIAGRAVRNQELLICKKDGTVFFGEVSASCLKDAHDNVNGVVINVRDISERKRNEMALRESEAMYRTRSAELETLFTLSLKLRKAQTASEVLDVVVQETQRFMQADAAAVLLLDDAKENFVFELARGTFECLRGKSFKKNGESISRQVVTTGKPYRTDDYSSEPCRIYHAEMNGLLESTGPSLFVPLQPDDEILGVLMLSRQKKPDTLFFDQDDLNLLSAIGDMTGNSLRKARLYDDLQRSHQQITVAYEDTIDALSRALDLRDKDTEGHTQRLIDLSLSLARRFGLDGEQLVHVRRGASLHDMGKIGIPDTILLKPGPLTEEEWKVMRRHPQYTYDMLSHIDYLSPALDIAYCHHERWDGSGYPRGLKGEEIPLSARLFAIVDVWDALVNERPYRAAWPKEVALEYIREQSGKYFDPKVVEVFLELI